VPEGLNNGHHFHTIVGGVGRVSGDFFCDLAVSQQGPVTARAWIATARSICKDLNYFGFSPAIFFATEAQREIKRFLRLITLGTQISADNRR